MVNGLGNVFDVGDVVMVKMWCCCWKFGVGGGEILGYDGMGDMIMIVLIMDLLVYYSEVC